MARAVAPRMLGAGAQDDVHTLALNRVFPSHARDVWLDVYSERGRPFV